MSEITVYILGVPFDYGIKLVGGRVGARFAPEKIRKEFFKLIGKNLKFKNIKLINLGDLKPVNNNPKKTHEKVSIAVKKIIKMGGLPVVIGGGHDISFGSGKAVASVYKKIGQINIDAHYDVRPVVDGKITSGTPFRRLLECGFLDGKRFVEFGAHAPKNLPEHLKYLIQKKATIMKLDQINKSGFEKSLKKAFLISEENTNAVLFDIDIDGVQRRFAPGCSAPGIKGFTKSQIVKSAYIAGKNKKVKLFNLMEVSPPYDVENKTVKLAAQIIFNFIKGLSEREK